MLFERIKKLWVGIALLIILCLETTVFNIGFWETFGLKECTVEAATAQELDDGTGFLSVYPAPQPGIRTIGIDGAEPIDGILEVTFTDDGNSNPIPITAQGVKALARHETVSLHTYGDLDAVQILSEQALDVPLTYNRPVPFHFNLLRVMLLFATVLVGRCFLGSCRLFKASYFSWKHDRLAWILLAAALSICFTAACFAIPTYLGSFTFEDGTFVYNYVLEHHAQYAELARAFANGHLYLDVTPPESLLALDNPYDPASRLAAHFESGDTYRGDTALFDGKYYVYFGVLPVLVFFLPWHLLTGTDFPTVAGIIVCLWAFIFGAVLTVRRIALRWFEHVSVGTFLFSAATVVISSMIVFVSKFAFLYQLPIIMALALLAWGAYAALSPRSGRMHWLVAVLAFTLILACRPQIFAFSFLAIPLFASWIRNQDGKRRAVSGVMVFAPALIIVAGLGMYNYLRFGSPFDFGANYNLTTNDMTLRPASPELAVTSLFYYFLQPPAIETSFPFLTPFEVLPAYEGFIVKEDMFGGLIWFAPIILLGLKPLGSVFAHGAHGTLGRYAAAAWILAVIVAVFDSLGAGIVTRYVLDFAFPLALMGMLTVFSASDCEESSNAEKELFWRRLLLGSFLVCLFASLDILYIWGEPGKYEGFAQFASVFRF